jgi:hypothetical protein
MREVRQREVERLSELSLEELRQLLSEALLPLFCVPAGNDLTAASAREDSVQESAGGDRELHRIPITFAVRIGPEVFGGGCCADRAAQPAESEAGADAALHSRRSRKPVLMLRCTAGGVGSRC